MPHLITIPPERPSDMSQTSLSMWNRFSRTLSWSLDYVTYAIIFLLTLTILFGLWESQSVMAFEGPKQEDAELTMDERRATAVALNYCRASFHRIRRQPSEIVIEEERDKILNNLNLAHISDSAVIDLYKTLLDEFGSIEVQDEQKKLFKSKFRRSLAQELAFDGLAMATQVSTAQFVAAVQTGANSWWDYRSMKWTRDLELMKLNQSRVKQVVQQSSKFLDTFWKLSQKQNIPDRWLVRSDDLDRLETALQEPNPAIRLRQLKRLEPFMEAYPPYYYYMARTEQQMGDFATASRSYEKLIARDSHHFRRDDMLSTAFANLALIRHHTNQGDATKAAIAALDQSVDSWQSNLLCAWVLQRQQSYELAEDAVLRNLDSDLEKPQSTNVLVSLYAQSGKQQKLKQALQNPDFLPHLNSVVLADALSRIPQQEMPVAAEAWMVQSVGGRWERGLTSNDFVLHLSPNWTRDFRQARLVMPNGHRVNLPATPMQDQALEIRMAQLPPYLLDAMIIPSPQSPYLELDYGNSGTMKLNLGPYNENEMTAQRGQVRYPQWLSFQTKPQFVMTQLITPNSTLSMSQGGIVATHRNDYLPADTQQATNESESPQPGHNPLAPKQISQDPVVSPPLVDQKGIAQRTNKPVNDLAPTPESPKASENSTPKQAPELSLNQGVQHFQPEQVPRAHPTGKVTITSIEANPVRSPENLTMPQRWPAATQPAATQDEVELLPKPVRKSGFQKATQQQPSLPASTSEIEILSPISLPELEETPKTNPPQSVESSKTNRTERIRSLFRPYNPNQN